MKILNRNEYSEFIRQEIKSLKNTLDLSDSDFKIIKDIIQKIGLQAIIGLDEESADWLFIDGKFVCGNCQQEENFPSNYCRNCGKSMNLDEHNQELDKEYHMKNSEVYVEVSGKNKKVIINE